MLNPEMREDLFSDLFITAKSVSAACGITITPQFDDKVRSLISEAVQPLWEAFRAEHQAQESARIKSAQAKTWQAVK